MDRFVEDLGVEGQTAFEAVVDGLRVVERKYWTRPQFDVLHGKRYQGMGEVRFDGDGKAYRVFGYFGPKKLHFTMLMGHEKKRSLKDEMDLAAKRRDFAESNRSLLYEFEF
jgi:hypothetical protein